jgi:hypothetical protein
MSVTKFGDRLKLARATAVQQAHCGYLIVSENGMNGGRENAALRKRRRCTRNPAALGPSVNGHATRTASATSFNRFVLREW